ncbi:LysR family transcriptional regulator [Niallia sp. 03133]|uniref:LysR family transcriptional regulator n=1 Tax=Niallia sp. 03133 TaxID=3458060 RepID=UPI00404493FE
MDIKQLTYFLGIVEEGNITRASKKLHIAQPHLSKQLKLLEAELGVKLMERSTRKIQMTDAGKLLQNRAKQIVELMDVTMKELKDFDEGIKGTLSIGAIASAGALLPERIYRYHQKYPDVNFNIRECHTHEILDLLNNGIVEIGIIRTPFNSEVYESILLPFEPMVAATCTNIFSEEQEESISLNALENKPLLIHSRYETMIIEACHQAGFNPKILGKIDDTKTILLWASKGMGIAIVPKDLIGIIPNINLKHKKINEPSLITRTAVIWKKEQYLSSVTKHFLENFEL